MKKPVRKICLLSVLAAIFLLLSAWTAFSGQGGVLNVIKNATAPVNVEKDLAVWTIPKNTVSVKPQYQSGSFLTEARKDKIERFKCGQCHNDEKITVGNAAAIAHGDIVLVHGGTEKPLPCFTCHSEEDRDFLTTAKGEKIDMDHSYQLCGQCHFRQKKDWEGGAHGKRLAHWVGQRVVKNCASCHDPHSPLFKKRWPKTYSRPIGE